MGQILLKCISVSDSSRGGIERTASVEKELHIMFPCVLQIKVYIEEHVKCEWRYFDFLRQLN